ncbi:MAG: DUF3482 domain-containing protein [Opitutaceae bacterium]
MSATITLTIAGHTNAGKTALARTLLCRDIGEVRDAPHVTHEVETHEWIAAEGWTLRLADTPGIDGAPRLLRRLKHAGNPLGWFMRELWDRTTDSGFYHTQIALRQVMRETDVVLYVVDTVAEHSGPGEATLAEIDLLAQLGKPAIAVLNQTGAAWTHAEAAAVESRWRDALSGRSIVRAVMTLDAFTRCWPCELLLLEQVARVVPGEQEAGIHILGTALQIRHRAVFEESMRAIAATVSGMAADTEALERAGFLGSARRVVTRLVAGSREAKAIEQLHARLKERLAQRYARLLDRLIELHGLSGRSLLRTLATGARDMTGAPESRLMMRELAFAAAGGAGAGGALDVVVGGASFGAGMAIGAVIGTLAAIGLGAHDLAEREENQAGWRHEAVVNHLGACMRAYLSVAHYGRGQGAWRDHDGPAYWLGVVENVIQKQRDLLLRAIRENDGALARMCEVIGAEVLAALYPNAAKRITLPPTDAGPAGFDSSTKLHEETRSEARAPVEPS